MPNKISLKEKNTIIRVRPAKKEKDGFKYLRTFNKLPALILHLMKTKTNLITLIVKRKPETHLERSLNQRINKLK